MKFLLFISSIFLCAIFSFSQLNSGFNPEEAKEMIALCNSYTYLDLYQDDSAIIPNGYKCIYSSPVVGLDNMFQVYTKEKLGVINFRGSTDKKSSWLENIHSALIPVEGTITIQDTKFNYKFASDTAAYIHSGYALSMAYLHEGILEQIKNLNKQGITNIILTGHSQGGALAILTRAYLEFTAKNKLLAKNTFKVYTFAQPMAGNKEFAKEYNNSFCTPGMSYSLINPDDAVPNMPLSYNDTSFVRDNLLSLFSKDQTVDKTQLLREGLMLLFEDKLKGTASKFGESVSKQIEKELGHIEMPKPSGEINFAQVGNIIFLSPPEYPLEMKDSTLLHDAEFMSAHPRDKNGTFLNKNVYQKTSMSLNHKPYNYYTATLRKYFPNEYNALEVKSFGL